MQQGFPPLYPFLAADLLLTAFASLVLMGAYSLYFYSDQISFIANSEFTRALCF